MYDICNVDNCLYISYLFYIPPACNDRMRMTTIFPRQTRNELSTEMLILAVWEFWNTMNCWFPSISLLEFNVEPNIYIDVG